MSRGHGPALRRALVCAVLLATAASARKGPVPNRIYDAPRPGQVDFTGKWLADRREMAVAGAATPPFTAAGRAEYLKRKAAVRAGKGDDPIGRCLPHGIPRLLYAPYPFLILEYGKQVTFIHEVNHSFRVVYFDAPIPDEPDPTYLGTASAKREGGALVIRSYGFNGQTWLDYAGMPHGEKLKVEERYSFVTPNRIRLTITIDDSEYYAKKWQTSLMLDRQSGMELRESVCILDHRM
jgi:hypothetical protein